MPQALLSYSPQTPSHPTPPITPAQPLKPVPLFQAVREWEASRREELELQAEVASALEKEAQAQRLMLPHAACLRLAVQAVKAVKAGEDVVNAVRAALAEWHRQMLRRQVSTLLGSIPVLLPYVCPPHIASPFSLHNYFFTTATFYYFNDALLLHFSTSTSQPRLLHSSTTEKSS